MDFVMESTVLHLEKKKNKDFFAERFKLYLDNSSVGIAMTLKVCFPLAQELLLGRGDQTLFTRDQLESKGD